MSNGQPPARGRHAAGGVSAAFQHARTEWWTIADSLWQRAITANVRAKFFREGADGLGQYQVLRILGHEQPFKAAVGLGNFPGAGAFSEARHILNERPRFCRAPSRRMPGFMPAIARSVADSPACFMVRHSTLPIPYSSLRICSSQYLCSFSPDTVDPVNSH